MNGLKQIMVATGMDSKKMANLLGVTPITVDRWAKGEMNTPTVRALSKHFGVTYQFLFGDSTESGNKDIDRLLQIVGEMNRIRERNEWL